MRKFVFLAIVLLPTLAWAQPQGEGQVETTDQANRNGVRGAVTSPLRDVNVIRTKIPLILLQAAQDPYARPKPNTCAAIIAEVRLLNEALGADLDEPPSRDQRDLTERGQGLAIDALSRSARDLIPLRSWVRKLSGAEQHDREVAAAISAGQIRRGYLKGLGESKNCLPPATPRHLANPPPPIEPERSGPRYPVR